MTVDCATEIWLKPSEDVLIEPIKLNHADHYPGPFMSQRLIFFKNHHHSEVFMPTSRLTEALQQALNLFPIFYGRLVQHASGNYEVHRSDRGIPFLERYSDKSLSYYEPNWPQSSITEDLQALDGMPPEDITMLFAAKITRLAHNSGVVLAAAWQHYITDGYGAAMFLRTWATFARGEAPPLPISSMPNHDRHLLVPDQPVAPYVYRELSGVTKHAARGVMVQFTPKKLKLLKDTAMASLTPQEREAGQWLSTMDVVIMLLWRALVRARQLPGDAVLTQGSAVNRRFQLDFIPRNYFGNAIMIIHTTKKASDLLDESLGTIGATHRQTIIAHKSISKNEWLSQADTHSSMPLYDRGLHWMAHTDYLFTDWSKFGYYTMDFGDGIPVRCRRCISPHRHMVCIFDLPPPSSSTSSDVEEKDLPRGLEANFNIAEEYYERLVNDNELLTYAELLG
ncbi:transferase [Syncephalis plumigaleata]|nr:transferase [Syncephalis plumigaleata]